MAITQDSKLMLRLSNQLTEEMDQAIKEDLKELNLTRSEFIRRSLRHTLCNLSSFLGSDSATVIETQPIEYILKINTIREIHAKIQQYTSIIQNEPGTSLGLKQMAHLIMLVSEEIFLMSGK